MPLIHQGNGLFGSDYCLFLIIGAASFESYALSVTYVWIALRSNERILRGGVTRGAGGVSETGRSFIMPSVAVMWTAQMDFFLMLSPTDATLNEPTVAVWSHMVNYITDY